MTISELGSLGEVIGALGLIVTLVFLAMEMRLKKKDESFRDIEQSQIRSQELNKAAYPNVFGGSNPRTSVLKRFVVE